MATGSEVQLIVGAAEQLRADGRRVRVVSIPSMDRFLASDPSDQAEVIPPDVTKRLAVEAGRTMGWQALVGSSGSVVGIDRFGESAPAGDLAEHFGFTVDNVLRAAKALL